MSFLFMRNKFKLIPGIPKINLNFYHETKSNTNILLWLTLLHYYHKRVYSTSLPATECLPFPVEDVEAYEELKDNENVPTKFIAYLGVARSHGNRRSRDSPLFPIRIWNVQKRVINNLPRTKNSVEGFQSALRYC